MKYPCKMFIILCLSGTALAVPGLAQETAGPPAVQAFLDNIERQSKVKPTYDSIEADGNGGATISNFAFSKPGESGQPGMKVSIAKAVFADVSEEDDGLYEIGSATFTDMKAEIDGPQFSAVVQVPEATAEDWYVTDVGDSPSPADVLRASSTVARKIETGKMSVSAQGQTATIDNMVSTWDGDPATGAGTYENKITNIAISEGTLAMLDQMGMLKQLGYNGLNFDMASKGVMSMKGDIVDYSIDFSLTGQNMGTVKLAVAVADLPLEVYAELQKAQTAGAQPDFTAFMPQIQNISFSNFSFRFEDGSLVGKLLPVVAAMQGMDQKQLIASAGPMLQMGLMQLQNQAFAEQTLKAVNDFLNDPKSLTIAAKPAAPVKVSELMTLNPQAPGEAITKLGLSVTSND